MKLIRAKKYKKIINDYAISDNFSDKNEFIYSHARGIYAARVFGFCIIRSRNLFNKLSGINTKSLGKSK